ERYGRDFYSDGAQGGRGVTGEELAALFDEVSGLKLKPFFDRYVRGTDDLPLVRLLAPFGIALEDGGGNGSARPSLGARTVKDGNDCKLASVYEGEAAHRAGLSAGDVLVAIDGMRITASSLDTVLGRYRAGDAITVHAFRRDE